MNNKQVKQMMLDGYLKLFHDLAVLFYGHVDKKDYAFDRIKLFKCNFKTKNLRFPGCAKISLTANQLKGK